MGIVNTRGTAPIPEAAFERLTARPRFPVGPIPAPASCAGSPTRAVRPAPEDAAAPAATPRHPPSRVPWRFPRPPLLDGSEHRESTTRSTSASGWSNAGRKPALLRRRSGGRARDARNRCTADGKARAVGRWKSQGGVPTGPSEY